MTPIFVWVVFAVWKKLPAGAWWGMKQKCRFWRGQLNAGHNSGIYLPLAVMGLISNWHSIAPSFILRPDKNSDDIVIQLRAIRTRLTFDT
jgi:hypothetical protein